MNEEVDQIEKNNTWTSMSRPKGKNVIGTKWVFRNKLNENGEVRRNKARLICKSYAQEGVDQGETFSPVERHEGVKTLVAYLAYKKYKVYQMDVKSIFLNGILEEEVYIEQPKGFVDLDKKNMVCKLKKTLYGLKKAPRTWYERLHNYLVKIHFEGKNYNSNLYFENGKKNEVLVSKIFFDDMIFGGREALCKSFFD